MKGVLALAIFSLSYGFYGHITRDTTWRDTVLITGDVVVDSGVCLTIEPGTVVRFFEKGEWDYESGFPENTDLIIENGVIKAMGTKQDSIFFIVAEDVEYYEAGAIIFLGGEGNIIEYSYIQIGTEIYIDNSSLIINNTIIKPSVIFSKGISCGPNSKVSIRNCVITPVGKAWPALSSYGIEGYKAKSIMVDSSVLTELHGGDADTWEELDAGAGIGIKCEDCEKVSISSCKIIGCGGGSGERHHEEPWLSSGNAYGIYLSNTSGEIKNTKILQVYRGGADAEGAGIVILGNSDVVIGGSSEDQTDIYYCNNYLLKNLTANDIIATYNYWGSTNPDTIAKYIFDKEDDSSRGKVIYEPWAEHPLGVRERLKDKGIKLRIYPNPFRGKVEIRWEMGKKNSEPLKIYDISGRLIKTFTKAQSPEPGPYKVVWNGRDDKGKRLPSGIYFIRAGSDIEKVIFLRGDND